MKATFNVFALLVLITLSIDCLAQKTVRVMDGDSTRRVPFILESGNISWRADNGELTLTRAQLNSNKDLIFKIKFSRPELYVVYKDKIYFKKGKSLKDKNLSFSDLKLNTLFVNALNIFFLRNKSSGLDDGNQ